MRFFIGIIFLLLFFICENVFAFSFPVGEKISYAVSWNGFNIGQTDLFFLGKVKVHGKEYYKIISESHTTQYDGFDIIYAEKDTLLPYKVFRKLKFMKKEEEILETYDQKNFTITINKISDGVPSVEKILKEGPIQNSVILYYIARDKSFNVGQKIDILLPTKQYSLRASAEKIEMGEDNLNRKTLFFQSSPRGIRLWIDRDKEHLPIKMVFTSFMSLVTMTFKKVVYLDASEVIDIKKKFVAKGL